MAGFAVQARPSPQTRARHSARRRPPTSSGGPTVASLDNALCPRLRKRAGHEYAGGHALWHASQEALAAERDRLAEERRLRRRAQWAARAAGILVLLCIAALVGVGLLSWSANRAKNSGSCGTNSRLLARIASASMDKEGPVTAALLALRGLPEKFDPPGRPLIPDTAGALETALAAQTERWVLPHDGPVSPPCSRPTVAPRPHRRPQTTPPALWDTASGQELRVLPGHEKWGPLRRVLARRRARPHRVRGQHRPLWETWPTVQALVEEARRRLPWQLTPVQEEQFGLRRTADGQP